MEDAPEEGLGGELGTRFRLRFLTLRSYAVVFWKRDTARPMIASV